MKNNTKNDYIDMDNALFDYEKEKRLLDELEENDIKLYSMILAKDKKIFCEKYYGIADCGRAVDIPNSRYALSRMFSIAKSFTSIAIGLLVDEKRIDLSDQIADYYGLLTGKRTSEADFDEWLQMTTIEDMLTMRSPHSKTTYKIYPERNWVESFFAIPSDKKPGESFAYDTSAAHVLCALVEKITGMRMLDYIRMKMPELGLSDYSYIMPDPFGVETGGSGLMCTSMDLMKFALMIENKGYINGRQVISADYLQRAVSNIVDTTNEKFSFTRNGYGYYFWQNKYGGYVAYGMQGQFIFTIPKDRLIVVLTSDCSKCKEKEDGLINIICKHLHCKVI